MRHAARNALIRTGGAVATVRGRSAAKRAICLHEVPDIARFRVLLDWLLARYDVVALEEWLEGDPGERTQVTLTFDDGYASWHESVAPVLVERGVPAVFFVSSGLVGLRGDAARDFARSRVRRTRELEFIGLDQLRELSDHPLFEIGSHTMTHADLGSLDRHAVRDEVSGDRARLADWLGREPRWFAYPFGGPANVSAEARAALQDLELTAAFTLMPGAWNPDGGDRLMIGRDGPDESVPLEVWSAWLRGGYDRLYALKSAPGRIRRPA
jgi:peptidoglycan/xylan/chitin deacetylase (PgdA/CDA1 family)